MRGSDAPAIDSKPRVLVVDDEEGILRTFRRILEPFFEVVTESCPAAALEVMSSGTSLDAVVCDVRMPVMSGLELLDVIRRERPPLAERFVFVTATPPDESKLHGTPVLTKPVKRSDLIEMVARLTGARIATTSWSSPPRPSQAPHDR